MTPKPAEAWAVSEIYELLRRAAIRRQPVAATYDGQPRLLCPHSVGRTFVLQHEGKAASVVHHRWLLQAACELPHVGGVHKSRSRPMLRQVSVSYNIRIRLAFGVM